MLKISLLLCIFITCHSCNVFKSYEPNPERELRGVWIATVANIDWPKNKTDSIDKKKEDYLKILDFYKNLNFNAVIVQVRTAGDAFYPTQKAPWSRFLTSKEGHADPIYDNILEWMIDQAHIMGFEFHAWLNPYRATIDENTKQLSKKHDLFKHPEWMIKYGKKYYFDPGIPSVKEHLTEIINEVVVNFNIDAIHFDDYFYPYKIKGEIFQDSLTYQKHKIAGQNIDDWRRSNVDSLVKITHKNIKKNKPWVQFGISPFGVWKNKDTDIRGSDTKAEQTSYDDLYADPLTWIENGWIDYIVPQIYWSMDYEKASHKKLLRWWKENALNTNLYIGNGTYKIRNNNDKAWNSKKEIPDQIRLSRQTTEVKGNVFFSARSSMGKNEDVIKILKRKYYSQQSLPPISKHSPFIKINKPKIEEYKVFKDSIKIKIKKKNPSIRYLLVYQKGKSGKEHLKSKIYIPRNTSKTLTISKAVINISKPISLKYFDKYRQVSKPLKIGLNH